MNKSEQFLQSASCFSDLTSILVPLDLGLSAALVGVSVPAGKRNGSEVADFLVNRLLQGSPTTDKDGADLRIHLRVTENHSQILPGGPVNVQGLINDDAGDTGQLDGLGADELLETVNGDEDNIGVGQEHVLIAGISDVDSGSGQLDASVMSEGHSIHVDSRIHILVTDNHKLIGTSEDALLHLYLSDRNGVLHALLDGQRSTNLHDNGGQAARSGDALRGDDAEDHALLQSANQCQLFVPQVGDSQAFKGRSDAVVDGKVPLQGTCGGLSTIVAARESLVQSDHSQSEVIREHSGDLLTSPRAQFCRSEMPCLWLRACFLCVGWMCYGCVKQCAMDLMRIDRSTTHDANDQNKFSKIHM